MIAMGEWIAAFVPMIGGHRSKATAQPMPNHCPPSLPMPSRFRSPADTIGSEFIGNNAHGNALETVAVTPSQPLPNGCPTTAQPLPTRTGAVAVRLASSDGQRLRFIADVSRPAPRDLEDAAEQFVDLMREAVRGEYLPASVRFADLRRFYDVIASEFEWPTISDVRLPKFLERNGCTKTVNRDRTNGRDKRTVAYLLR